MHAADIGFANEWEYKRFTTQLEKVVSATLFVPRQAKVMLYKLSIYRDGGHFDWHVDTTQCFCCTLVLSNMIRLGHTDNI